MCCGDDRRRGIRVNTYFRCDVECSGAVEQACLKRQADSRQHLAMRVKRTVFNAKRARTPNDKATLRKIKKTLDRGVACESPIVLS